MSRDRPLISFRQKRTESRVRNERETVPLKPQDSNIKESVRFSCSVRGLNDRGLLLPDLWIYGFLFRMIKNLYLKFYSRR